GLDKLKGKKIVHIFHNSPYGKEANPTLETLARQLGFELTLLAVDHPGQEQGATWLQIRRINPDWIFMSGWGVMNQVAIKEAASKNFKMDHFIGNWWSANDADVIPAGDGAKGYKGATFHAPGTKFKVHADIFKVLYDKNKGAGKRESVGEALYNRGIVNAMYTAEAIRTAMARFGNKPITGEQLRWGLEHLNLTDARLEQLGMKGFTHPIKVTCEDHEGSGAGKSTTLKAISGLLRTERGDVTKGTIEFQALPIHRKDPAEVVKRGIVQVMEGRHVFEHLTVEENLLTGGYTRKNGHSTKRELELVYRYFPRLAERRQVKAGYISGGEQQMVA